MRAIRSAKLIPAARTRTRTRPGVKLGSGTSRSASVSGSPVFSMTTARMAAGSLAAGGHCQSVGLEALVRAAHEAHEHVGDRTAVGLARLVLLIGGEADEVAAVRDATAPVERLGAVGVDELGRPVALALACELPDQALTREVPEIDVHERRDVAVGPELDVVGLRPERAEAGLLAGTRDLDLVALEVGLEVDRPVVGDHLHLVRRGRLLARHRAPEDVHLLAVLVVVVGCAAPFLGAVAEVVGLRFERDVSAVVVDRRHLAVAVARVALRVDADQLLVAELHDLVVLALARTALE